MTKPAINTIDYGKIPPQALDLEEAVIGAVMLEKDAILMVNTFLTAEMFYKTSHQLMYQAIIDLQLITSPIDILTVTTQLRKNDTIDTVGGPFYITQLTSKVSSAAHIQYHARIIEQKYLQRQVIVKATEYLGKAYDDTIDVNDLIDEFTIDIMKINTGVISQMQQIGAAVEKSIDHIHELVAGNVEPFGIKTRLKKFDRATNGLQKGVTIIAARPGMGKTAFVLQLINNITADQNIPTALFELEMFEEQLIRWMQSQRTGIKNEWIKKGYGYLNQKDVVQIERASVKLKDAPLFVDYTPGINIMQLRSKAIQLKNTQDIQLIIIDYMQLMGNVNKSNKGFQNREGEVSEISRGIRELSKELDIPIIALSQLNRGVLNRTDKRPNLGDLRESGAIEQDADMVIFIHRPEKFGIIEDENGDSLIGVTELIFAKHRDGGNSPVEINFDAETISFNDLESDNPNQFTEPSTDPF